MKQTLLEIVQDILNDLDSDEVSSINDTVEAMQVAQIVKSCYDELTSNRNWPNQQTLLQLEASGSLDYPNYLKIPDSVKEIVSLQYNKASVSKPNIQYRELKYLYPDEFLLKINNRDSEADNIEIITDFSAIDLLILNDKAPEYWTSFDDEYVVCDSYDKAVDDTLKKIKTQAVCYIEHTFTLDDHFTPTLPSEAFALLREEAKSTAFITLKQMANQKAEMKASRQNRWLSRKAWKAHGGVRYPNYGRRGSR